MKKCSKCGEEIFNEAVICPKCGCAQPGTSLSKPTFSACGPWAALFSFFIPVVGVILFFVWNAEKPEAAKDAMKFALVGLATYLIATIGGVILLNITTNRFMEILQSGAVAP